MTDRTMRLSPQEVHLVEQMRSIRNQKGEPQAVMFDGGTDIALLTANFVDRVTAMLEEPSAALEDLRILFFIPHSNEEKLGKQRNLLVELLDDMLGLSETIDYLEEDDFVVGDDEWN